jgi:hypothetical protein
VAALADELESSRAVEVERVLVGLDDERPIAGAPPGIIETGAAMTAVSGLGRDCEVGDFSGHRKVTQGVDGHERTGHEAAEQLRLGISPRGRQREGSCRDGAGTRRRGGDPGAGDLRVVEGAEGNARGVVGGRPGRAGFGIPTGHQSFRRFEKGSGSL